MHCEYSTRPGSGSHKVHIDNIKQEHRHRHSSSLWAAPASTHDSGSEVRPCLGDEEEQDERCLLLGGEGDAEAASRRPESPRSWYSSLVGSHGGWLAAAGVSIITGIGVIAWWAGGPPTPERERENQEFLARDR
ncbi:hypothetical protein LX36DRAFT_382273 [Colletotrichum falcatum]|nr:hypothetical protein LX36DRAFT_382273 [Colletotrichum falcatum]